MSMINPCHLVFKLPNSYSVLHPMKFSMEVQDEKLKTKILSQVTTILSKKIKSEKLNKKIPFFL